jgi:hypothetical protein
MPGVVEVRATAAIGAAIDDLVMVLECCTAEDVEDAVLYVPL